MLRCTLESLDDEAYLKALPVLGGASIGQHVRHVAEMYVCLFEGMPHGTVCYERRKRDVVVETCKSSAIALLREIETQIEQPDRALILDANYETEEMVGNLIPSSYLRELAYNLEHTIHHMALIRIGIEAVSKILLDPCFGVAPSTVRHRKHLIAGA